MYNIYDKVSHPVHGICQIIEIYENADVNTNQSTEYYKLIPFSGTLSAIFVPVQKADEIGLRALITKQEAELLMDAIPEMDEEWILNISAKQKKYHSLFIENTLEKFHEGLSFLSTMIRQDKNNGLGIADKSMLVNLKNKLIPELAFVLDMSDDEVLHKTENLIFQ